MKHVENICAAVHTFIRFGPENQGEKEKKESENKQTNNKKIKHLKQKQQSGK